MQSMVQVTVHTTQFPENVQRALLTSLRTRRVNHKFLYDGIKHAQKWLALHDAYSPARVDPDCVATYGKAFAAAAGKTAARRVHVIGLGCGGGHKDAQLLKRLKRAGKKLSYTPCDVSLAMVLAACRTVSTVVRAEECFPIVCDLAETDNWAGIFGRQTPPGVSRLITFFGMLPNFEPQAVLPRLSALLRPHDRLLLGANLAPGQDYDAGVQRILPQYDNALARDWLMTFLLDLGVERTDGEVRFAIEDRPDAPGLKRVRAAFHFNRRRTIQLAKETFEFQPGDFIRLFFSYRHTPDRVRELLGQQGVSVIDQWITRSEEEGVFLCRRARSASQFSP